ncbi:MAG: ABC transporter substrate-binding protein [Pseudomonadota bacterium]
MTRYNQNSTLKPSKFVLLLCLVVLVLAGAMYFGFKPTSPEREPERIVCITQIVQHPSLDKIRGGIENTLHDFEKKAGVSLKVIYDNAQGNIATATQIANKFVGLRPDVIVAITTPSAQTVKSVVQESSIPVVFSAVTDPLGAGLVENLQLPGGNVTGTIDAPPVEKQIEVLLSVLPDVKTVGVIYNPGEVNAVIQSDHFAKLANEKGLKVIRAVASKTSEVLTAATRLVGVVNAIYIPNDNTVVSALESLLKVAEENHIPTMASDPDSVKRGATFAVANDQYQVGQETGRLILQVLTGTPPGQIPVERVKGLALYLNEVALKKMHLQDSVFTQQKIPLVRY